MKSFFLLSAACCVAASLSAQQLPNSDFGQWNVAGNTYQSSKPVGNRQRPGEEPTGWQGSSVNQQVLFMEKKETLVEKSDRNGDACVKLTNKFVGVATIGSNAPAFISFATPWVYAVTKIADCDGGAYGGLAFTHRPDAVKGLFKRSGGTDEKAHIIAYLWKGTFTSQIKSQNGDVKEDVDRVVFNATAGSEGGTLIAKCDYAFSTTANTDWEEITVPLEYQAGAENLIPEKINVIISSADYWTRGNIKANSVLEVDNVELVYYSHLKSLSYNGQPVPGFAADKYAYEVDGDFNANGVEAVKAAVGGSCNVTADEANTTFTITVTAEDGVQKVYTLKVNVPQPVVTPYTSVFSISSNGVVMGEPLSRETNLIEETDETMTFELKNVMQSSTVGIGTLRLTNLTKTTTGYRFQGKAAFVAGDQAGVAEWVGPGFGELDATLSATLKDDVLTYTVKSAIPGMGDVVFTFAPNQTLDANTTVLENGLTHLTVNTDWKAGWNVVCVPFALSLEQLPAGAKLAQYTGATSGEMVNFTTVEAVSAGEPCLLWLDEAMQKVTYCAGNRFVAKKPSKGGVKFVGVYTATLPGETVYELDSTKAPIYVLKPQAAPAQVSALSGWFEMSGDAQEVKVCIDGTVTAIAAPKAELEGAAPAWNLQGVRVAGNKGLFIQNGKVVLKK